MHLEEQTLDRVLGRFDGKLPGPMLIALGGIHGNEPAGVVALQRVVLKLQEVGPEVVGSFVALAGNLGALARQQRFLSRDLNRSWTAPQVKKLQGRDPAEDTAEDHEQRELLKLFEELVGEARGPVVFLDLHSSSADGASFSCLADTIPNRRIARSLPVPTILGLEECIDGAVMEFFSERGLVGVAVEGGKHDDPRTSDNLEAATWLTLAATGVLAEDDVDLDGHARTLQESARGLPPVLEIRHRQVITPEDEFVMEPGFQSFQRILHGQLLARDKAGELRAKENGRLLLPLYQGQGEDGYFLCRPVHPIWLHVAAIMRWLRIGSALPFLPGVKRDPDNPNALLVNPRVARFLVVQVFHLLGFRKRRQAGDMLRFSRRRVNPSAWQLRRRRRLRT